MKGFFKIRMRRFKRWFVVEDLVDRDMCEEWLYFDGNGVPILYWRAGMSGVMLVG